MCAKRRFLIAENPPPQLCRVEIVAKMSAMPSTTVPRWRGTLHSKTMPASRAWTEDYLYFLAGALAMKGLAGSTRVSRLGLAASA